MSSLRDLVGVELGPTSWIEITQERIDAFAAATDDPQWIHVDAARAGEGPFGTTIAHGYLTLSLTVPMLDEVLPEDGRMSLNYGMNPLAGQLLSDLDWKDVEANVSRAILAFEPRVLPESLSVTLLPSFDSLNHHNTLQFEIRCQFWSMPYPLELLLKTSLDLETGQVVLSDLRN